MYLLFLFTIPFLRVIGNVFFSRLIVKGKLLLLHSSVPVFSYLMVVNMCDRNM